MSWAKHLTPFAPKSGYTLGASSYSIAQLTGKKAASPRQEFRTLTKHDEETLTELGEGTFGTVYAPSKTTSLAVKSFKKQVSRIQELKTNDLVLKKLRPITRDKFTLLLDEKYYDNFKKKRFIPYRLCTEGGKSLDSLLNIADLDDLTRIIAFETTAEALIEVLHDLSSDSGDVPPVHHHDIKPENIMYFCDGVPSARIIDFGLASVKPYDGGTPLYMPHLILSYVDKKLALEIKPIQSDIVHIDINTIRNTNHDSYSAGLTLFEVLGPLVDIPEYNDYKIFARMILDGNTTWDDARDELASLRHKRDVNDFIPMNVSPPTVENFKLEVLRELKSRVESDRIYIVDVDSYGRHILEFANGQWMLTNVVGVYDDALEAVFDPPVPDGQLKHGERYEFTVPNNAMVQGILEGGGSAMRKSKWERTNKTVKIDGVVKKLWRNRSTGQMHIRQMVKRKGVTHAEYKRYISI